MQRETERHHHKCAAKKREIPMVAVVVTVAAGEIIKMKEIVVAPVVEVQDAVVVDPTLDPNPALPGAVNAPHVANEAVIVTVTPGEKGNESELAHPHGHAQHHPHDQLHGHAPAHQQQSSVIKKRNRVVDKVGQPAPTELFNTEKLSLSMLSTGACP